MGTHDHYCEHGVAAVTWNGTEYFAHGDGFLDTRVDTPRIAVALAKSLGQFVDALSGPWTVPVAPEVLAARSELNACKQGEGPTQLDQLIGTDLVRPLEDVP
jgi:hypothetical protein